MKPNMIIGVMIKGTNSKNSSTYFNNTKIFGIRGDGLIENQNDEE